MATINYAEKKKLGFMTRHYGTTIRLIRYHKSNQLHSYYEYKLKDLDLYKNCFRVEKPDMKYIKELRKLVRTKGELKVQIGYLRLPCGRIRKRTYNDLCMGYDGV